MLIRISRVQRVLRTRRRWPAMHWRVSTQRRSCASDGSSCRVGNLQGLCFSPPFPFPKRILFIVSKKDAACLSYLWAVCYRAKNIPLHMPHRKNCPDRFRIQRRKMLSKSQDQTKTPSDVITARRQQFRVLSSAPPMVNPLRTVHFCDSTSFCAPHPMASCVLPWQNKTQLPVKAAGFHQLLPCLSPTHSHWPWSCLISLA